MNDELRSKADLISELHRLRRRLEELEGSSRFVGDDSEPTEINIAPVPGKSFAKAFPEAFWRVFQDHGAVMYIVDLETFGIIDANRAALDFYGYDLATIRTKRIPDLNITPEPEIRAEIESALEEGRSYYVFKHRLADGDVRDVEIYANPIVVNGKEYSFSIVHDITGRRQTEKALRKNEEFNRRLVAHIPQRVFLKDRDLRYVSCNENFARDLDLDPEEMIGRDDLALFPPELAEKYRADDRRVMETETPIIVEEPFRTDTEDRWVKTSKVPFHDADGRVIGVLGIFEDVTESRRAAEALQASEERNRRILLTAMEGFWRTDTNGRILEVNQAYCRMSGFEASELLTMHIFDLDAGERPRDTMNRMKSLMAKGADRFESRHRRKDGSIFDVEVSVQFLDGPGDGECVVFLRDISERKEAEAALKKSEGRFRRLFENAPMGIAVHSLILDSRGSAADYLITDVNPPFSEILDIDRQAVLGKKATEAYGTDKAPFLDIYAPVAQGRGSTQFRTYFPPMEKHFSIVVYSPAADEFVTVFSDITEQMESRTRLMESEARFRAIFEQAAMGVCLVSLKGRFLMVNERLCRMWRYSPEELLQLNFGDITHPEDYRIGPALVDKLLSGEILSGSIEKRYIKKDGDPVHCALTTSLVRDADGKPKHFVTIIEDITKQKQAEEEKEILQHQLQQAQKMDALGTLAGGIAHDFNNILAAIIGYSELAIEDIKHGLDVTSTLAGILKAGKRAKDLVTQILTFSRKLKPVLKPIDLNQVIADTEKLLLRTIPRMVKIEHNLAAGLWPINADPGQMTQVLMNLASNANDAMPEGGRLVIETKNVTLSDEYCRRHAGASPGDYVLLTVSDTGHGIRSESLEQIFDPFFTDKEIGKGTGLGLATVYGIVKSHDGNIICYSEVGQGTTFKAYLPATRSTEATADPEEAEEELRGGHETILLVDDEESLRDLGRGILERSGYQVVTAETGETAVEIYESGVSGLDLVILDINMPGMGGHKCLVELLEIDPAVKVVVASGYSRNGQLKETMSLGAVGFIPKPFSKRDILSAVREALDG